MHPSTFDFAKGVGLAVFVCLSLCPTVTGENWSQFRGPNGQGVAPTSSPPIEFGADRSELWSVAVLPGHSSPSLWGDRLYLTSVEKGRLACEAYDRASGQQLWTRSIEAEELEETHRFSNPAAPTVAANDNQVVAYFGSFGLISYDHEGKELWRVPLPAPKSRGNYGSASSPVIVDGVVVQTLDSQEGTSRIIGVDLATGAIRWDTPRPLFTASWSTPVLFDREGEKELLVLGSKKLVAYDPGNGEEQWSVDGYPAEAVVVPAVGDGLIFAGGAAMGGRSNPEFDALRWSNVSVFDDDGDGALTQEEIPEGYHAVQRSELLEGHPGRRLPWPLRGMIKGMDKDKDGKVTEAEWTASLASFEARERPVVKAVRPGNMGSAASDEQMTAWSRSRGVPEIPSPLFYEGKVFLIRDGGVLQCMEATSGKVLYDERLGVGGGYCASPVAADGRVYFASHSGTVVVVDGRSEDLEVLARNELGEAITATPAIQDDCLYVRTSDRLYAFGHRESAEARSSSEQYAFTE